jgi:hypothetical protein
MREEILVATSPKQAKALRAQGALNVVRVSNTHTEVVVPVQGGGTTVLWRPFRKSKQLGCARAFAAVLEAYRA